VHSFDQGEGFSRFDIPQETMHFHLVCRQCGKSEHLADEAAKEKIVEGWVSSAGYEIVPQAFQLFGICHECREKGQGPAPQADPGFTCCGRRRHGCNR